MKFKQLIKSYSFWTTLAGAIVVLVQVLGRIFNFSISNDLVHDLIMAIAGVLVALGIVTLPKVASETDDIENKESEEKADEEKTEEKEIEDTKTDVKED